MKFYCFFEIGEEPEKIKKTLHSFSEFGINRLNAPHLFQSGFVLFSFKMSLMLSLPIVSNPSFFLNSSQRSVSDRLLRPSGQGVHANAITSAICFSLYFMG